MEPSVPAEVEGEQKERKKIHFAVPASVSADVEGEQKERKKIHFAVPASVSADVEGEQKERKKIHFAVPASVPTNLDPRQVEMIRRRRPTPATLFRVADQASPEDDQSTHQWVVGENGVLKPKRVNPNVYQPPSLKAVQKMAEAHMQNLGVYPPLEDPSEGEEYEDHWQGEEGDHSSPTQAADHPEAAATDQPQSAKQIQVQEEEEDEAAAEEEEEAEEVDRVAKAEETTEGERKRGGSN